MSHLAGFRSSSSGWRSAAAAFDSVCLIGERDPCVRVGGCGCAGGAARCVEAAAGGGDGGGSGTGGGFGGVSGVAREVGGGDVGEVCGAVLEPVQCSFASLTAVSDSVLAKTSKSFSGCGCASSAALVFGAAAFTDVVFCAGSAPFAAPPFAGAVPVLASFSTPSCLDLMSSPSAALEEAGASPSKYVPEEA